MKFGDSELIRNEGNIRLITKRPMAQVHQIQAPDYCGGYEFEFGQ